MRFRRWPRPERYADTPRKRAALAKRQRLEREALPLLAELIGETQPAADTVMATRARRWDETTARTRQRRSDAWRSARSHLRRLDPDGTRGLARLWNRCPFPGDPAYLADLLTEIERGTIDPIAPPWERPTSQAARITPTPATFEDAFRQIGRRTVGGGQKTTGADETTFCGNLGAGLLILVSRVRLIDPMESFMTSSNHRLRDSHVGRAGHWIDIQVSGPCCDADLALIQRLAQAADSRPVVVRRKGQGAPHT